MNRNNLKLRPIPDFSGYYVEEVPGNIWSFRVYENGQVLKPWVTGRNKKTKIPTRVSVDLYKNGKCYTRTVSRLIMNVTDPKIEVDHEDRNIWNNKRSNLRKATRSQQNYNTAPRSKTGFKCVYVHDPGFQAQTRVDGKLKNLGSYSNIFEAAAVANLAACKHHSEFAVYNKVDGHILTL